MTSKHARSVYVENDFMQLRVDVSGEYFNEDPPKMRTLTNVSYTENHATMTLRITDANAILVATAILEAHGYNLDIGGKPSLTGNQRGLPGGIDDEA